MKFVFITLIFVSLQHDCFLGLDTVYSRVNNYKAWDSDDYLASMFGYQNPSPRLNYMTQSLTRSNSFNPEKAMGLFDLPSSSLLNRITMNSMSNTGSLFPERAMLGIQSSGFNQNNINPKSRKKLNSSQDTTYKKVLQLLENPNPDYSSSNSISSTTSTGRLLPVAKTTTTVIHHNFPMLVDNNMMSLTKPSKTKIITNKTIEPVAATRSSKPKTDPNGDVYKGKVVKKSQSHLRSATI